VDIIEALKLLERSTTGYRAMYAHGMHLQVQSAKYDKVTCNRGVAPPFYIMEGGGPQMSKGIAKHGVRWMDPRDCQTKLP